MTARRQMHAPRARRSALGLALAGSAIAGLGWTSLSFASGPSTLSARSCAPFAIRSGPILGRLSRGVARAARGGEEEWAVGDKLKAKSPDDEQWYPGTFDSLNDDGTITVKWDDPDGGPETQSVEASAVKKIIIFKDYAVGDDVKAAPPDDDNWYSGVVSKINTDGTFQVKWDDPDGGPETADCDPEYMKKMNVFKDYKVGDVVDAVFPDDGQMYPGTVTKINDDGTFQVKWEDPDGGPEESPCTAKEMKYPPIPFDKLEVGQKYTGTVRTVREFGAFVDIGAENDGLLHVSRMSTERVEDPNDYVEEGDEVDVWISGLRDDGKFGLTMVEGRLDGGSGPRAPADLTPFVGIHPEEWLTGTVRNMLPFGAFVTVTAPDDSGVVADGLVHISQIRDGFVDNIEDELEIGQEVSVRVRDVDTDAGKMSLTMKSADAFGGGGGGGGFQSRPPSADLSAFADIPSDQMIKGTVAQHASFGIFVTVKHPETGDQADGLVHITQIRDGFVERVEDEVDIGQEVDVRIQSVDVDAGKMSLSMKEEGFGGGGGFDRPAPADLSAFESIPSDQWLKGTVARHAPFGLFVTVKHPETEAEADGLVHITQIRDGFVERAEDEAEVGQEVDVWIQSVDVDAGKLSLSMKHAGDE